MNGQATCDGVKIERNELVVDSNGGRRSKGTGAFELIEAGLLLRSIGYRSVPIEGVPIEGVPIEGVPIEGVPFDRATSTINNIAGRSCIRIPVKPCQVNMSSGGPSAAPPA